jgi:rubrerythrin
MIIKELGDSAISRNDIVADMAGLFFGTAVLAGLFLTGNAAVNKEGRSPAKLRDRVSSGGFIVSTRRQEVSLRELLMAGLKLAHLGARFYSKTAEVVKDLKARELCLELAQVETRNAEQLSFILNAWLPSPIRPSIVEWTQMFIFKNDLYNRKFSSSASEKEILKYAIRCDEKMRRFYRYFRNSFPELWKRMQLDELIQAEVDQKRGLQDILRELRAKKRSKIFRWNR